MRLYRAVFLAFFIVIFAAMPGTANLATAATITVHPPLLPAAIYGTASWIFIDGEIDEKTPQQFLNLLSEYDVKPYSSVYFDSPGGALLPSLELGRIIRSRQLNTFIGAPATSDEDLLSERSGVCFSACTLSYLGGVFRYSNKKGRYGVHRFYFDSTSASNSDNAQIISAAITNYLQEMGIGISFFELMTHARRTEVYEPSIAELAALGVYNNGVTPPVWTVESNDEMLYLKGERQTAYGINKFMVHCNEKTLFLYVIFDPQGRTEEVLEMQAHSLVLDGKYYSIQPAEKLVKNGWFNAIYLLSRSTLEKLENAHSVGLILQYSKDAPVFLGFDDMPFDAGRKKLQGLIKNCR